MGTMSSRGALEPARGVVVVWGSLTGLAAAVLLRGRRAHRAAAGGDHRGRAVRVHHARACASACSRRCAREPPAATVAAARAPSAPPGSRRARPRASAPRPGELLSDRRRGADADQEGMPVPRAVRPLRRDAADTRASARHPGERTASRAAHDTAWVPTTDIFARGEDLVIRCELAGVDPDDVEISCRAACCDLGRARSGARPGRRGRATTCTSAASGRSAAPSHCPEGIDTEPPPRVVRERPARDHRRAAARPARTSSEIAISDRAAAPRPRRGRRATRRTEEGSMTRRSASRRRSCSPSSRSPS